MVSYLCVCCVWVWAQTAKMADGSGRTSIILASVHLLHVACAQQTYTELHNAKRCLHCDTSSATRSSTLEAQAASYAATCPTGHASASDRDGAGENLYWYGYMGAGAPTEAASFESAVTSWYDAGERLA